MKQAVYKYYLPTAPCSCVIALPVSSSILTVECQRGLIVLYALVNVAEIECETHEFIIAETGQEIQCEGATPLSLLHHKTVMLHNGDYVLHVFEKVPFTL